MSSSDPVVGRAYVLPPTTVTDEATGEDMTVPKYTDRDDVDFTGGSLVPAPQAWLDAGHATTENGEVYVVTVRAPESVHGQAAGQADAWRIGQSGDVTPRQAADYLNGTFRPSSLDDPELPEDYRHLGPGEWAERLGLGTGEQAFES